MYVVFDGVFLTAQRKPRFSEVKQILDEAVASGKCSFSMENVPFTSGMDHDVAVKVLLGVGPKKPLTGETRPEYFELFGTVTEAQYNTV